MKTLKAETLTIKNTSKQDQVIQIYVPNKDSMPYVLKKGDPENEGLTITTLSAGESYFYYAQATDVITVEAQG